MEYQEYSQIVLTLRREILGGKYSSSMQPFPSERALARRFAVNRSVITRVLQELSVKGFLCRKQGKGTFLTKRAQKISRAIGLIVPGNCYAEIFPPICHELSRLAQERDMTLVLGDVTSSSPEERAKQVMAIAQKFAADQVSGVIYQPTEFVNDVEGLNRSVLNVLKAAGVPVVIIDWDIVPSPRRSEFDLVGIDNFDAGRRMGEHLVEMGAKQIRFLVKPNSAYSIGARILGVKSCVRNAGSVVVEVDVTDVKQIKALLCRTPRPDALVCGNDTHAARLLVTLRKLGVKVPEDVMVAGFDDVQHASLVVPALTTIHQPCADIARKAFDVLLARIMNSSSAACACLLTSPLVIRESTARKISEGKTKGKEKKDAKRN